MLNPLEEIFLLEDKYGALVGKKEIPSSLSILKNWLQKEKEAPFLSSEKKKLIENSFTAKYLYPHDLNRVKALKEAGITKEEVKAYIVERWGENVTSSTLDAWETGQPQTQEKATSNIASSPQKEIPQQKTKGKIAHHEHEGYPLHPVSVKHHQEYFTTHPGVEGGIPSYNLPPAGFNKLKNIYDQNKKDLPIANKEDQIKSFVGNVKQHTIFTLDEVKNFLTTLGKTNKIAPDKMQETFSMLEEAWEGGEKKPSSSEEIYQSAKNLFESLSAEKGINEAKQLVKDLKEKGVSFQDFIKQYKKVYEETYNVPLTGAGMKEFWDSSPGEEIEKPPTPKPAEWTEEYSLDQILEKVSEGKLSELLQVEDGIQKAYAQAFVVAQLVGKEKEFFAAFVKGSNPAGSWRQEIIGEINKLTGSNYTLEDIEKHAQKEVSFTLQDDLDWLAEPTLKLPSEGHFEKNIFPKLKEALGEKEAIEKVKEALRKNYIGSKTTPDFTLYREILTNMGIPKEEAYGLRDGWDTEKASGSKQEKQHISSYELNKLKLQQTQPDKVIKEFLNLTTNMPMELGLLGGAKTLYETFKKSMGNSAAITLIEGGLQERIKAKGKVGLALSAYENVLIHLGYNKALAKEKLNSWLDYNQKEPPKTPPQAEWTKNFSLNQIFEAISEGNLSGLTGVNDSNKIDQLYIDAFFAVQANGKEDKYWEAWDKRNTPGEEKTLTQKIQNAGGIINKPIKTISQEEANKILEKDWPDVMNSKMSVQTFYSGLKNKGVTKELFKKFLEDREIVGIKTIMEDYDEFSGKKIEPILTPQKVNIAPSKAPFTEAPKLITSTSGYNYKFIKSLGGSHPGGQYENTKTGEKNYIKFPSPEQAKYEYLTNLLYKLAGVPVNNMELLDAGESKLGVKTEWLEGENMLPPKELISSPDVMKNFVFDAWLGNYDVLGTDYSNILKSGNHFFRIDQGSGLIFRARGAKKEFGPEVKELETFLDPNMNKEGSKVFGGVPKEALKEFNRIGAKKLSKITDIQIDNVLGSVALSVADKKQLSTTLKARRDYIVKKVLGKASKEPLPYPLTLKKGKPKGVGYFLSKNKLTKALWDKKIGNKLEVEDIAREYGVEKEFKTIERASSSWQSGNREGQIKIRAAIAKLSGREHDQYLNDSQYYIYDSQKSSVEFEEAFKLGMDNASGILPLVKKSQNYLKEKYPQGSITVYRGLSGTVSDRIRTAHRHGAKTITMPNDGHSGWSPSKSVARSFGSVVFSKKVPIEAIWIDFNSFSSSYTNEKELIVDSSYTEIFNRDEVEIS